MFFSRGVKMRLHDAVTIITATSKARCVILIACTCDCPTAVNHTTGMPWCSHAAILLPPTWRDPDADRGISSRGIPRCRFFFLGIYRCRLSHLSWHPLDADSRYFCTSVPKRLYSALPRRLRAMQKLAPRHEQTARQRNSSKVSNNE